MSQKYTWLFANATNEYAQLKENVIDWLGLVFIDYIALVYHIELEATDTLVLTDNGMSQQTTGIGYGINLPTLPACKVLYHYRPSLVDDVLAGRADEAVVTQAIREFFRDYINYAKIWIANPCKFIKVAHKDLICPKPGQGAISTLGSLKHGKL